MITVRRLVVALLFVPVTIWGACAIYDTTLLLPSDAGIDASVEAGPDASDPCQHAFPPPRPNADDPDGGDFEFTVAVTSLDLGLDAGAAFSFDLDRVCTCPGPESCKPVANAPNHCDDPQGRDNSGGALIAKFAGLSDSFSPTKLNDSVQKGRGGLLFRLRHYNGLPNDRSVEVGIFSSNGTMGPDGGTSNVVPKHDGNDDWSSSPGSLLGGGGPPFVPNFVDINGYVSGGVFVANADFPFRFSGALSSASFTLHGTSLVATVEPVGQTFVLHQGRFAGRWSSRELLTSLAIVKDPISPGKFLCGSDVTYQDVKVQICKAADLSSNLLADFGAPCDALSIAFGFDTEPARLSGVIPDGPSSSPCGATYTDQCQ